VNKPFFLENYALISFKVVSQIILIFM